MKNTRDIRFKRARTEMIRTEKAANGHSFIGKRDAEIRWLIQEHMAQIGAAAQRVLGPDYVQAMDDLSQQVCIAIWRTLEKGQTIEHWGGFIYHCAHKRALDLLKQSRRRARREISLDDLRGDHETPAEELFMLTVQEDLFNEALTLLDEELAKLPTPIRLTVLLRIGEGYSRAEVAQMLRCSTATVDYRVRQGLSRLRKRLKQRGLQSGNDQKGK
jgi:RNA polymerase sigma factor (sigma-70 family)